MFENKISLYEKKTAHMNALITAFEEHKSNLLAQINLLKSQKPGFFARLFSKLFYNAYQVMQGQMNVNASQLNIEVFKVEAELINYRSQRDEFVDKHDYFIQQYKDLAEEMPKNWDIFLKGLRHVLQKLGKEGNRQVECKEIQQVITRAAGEFENDLEKIEYYRSLKNCYLTYQK